MSLRRVVVTGLGAVTPMGVGAKHAWSAIKEGRSGVVRTDLVDHGGHAREEWARLPSRVAGLVPRGKERHHYDEESLFDPGEVRSTTLGMRFGIVHRTKEQKRLRIASGGRFFGQTKGCIGGRPFAAIAQRIQLT